MIFHRKISYRHDAYTMMYNDDLSPRCPMLRTHQGPMIHMQRVAKSQGNGRYRNKRERPRCRARHKVRQGCVFHCGRSFRGLTRAIIGEATAVEVDGRAGGSVRQPADRATSASDIICCGTSSAPRALGLLIIQVSDDSVISPIYVAAVKSRLAAQQAGARFGQQRRASDTRCHPISPFRKRKTAMRIWYASLLS